MTFERLRAFYIARPFQRFIMHLADGRQVPVEHPEWIMLMPGGRTVYVTQRDETVNVVDLLLVTDLEIKPATASQGAQA